MDLIFEYFTILSVITIQHINNSSKITLSVLIYGTGNTPELTFTSTSTKFRSMCEHTFSTSNANQNKN